MNKPFFIVFEGIDRCGKSLQADLLARRLREVGVPTEVFTTPDYNCKTGQVINSHLHGEVYLARGQDRERSAHDELVLQSLLIANRYAVADRVRRWLAGGNVAVVVRWIPSAMLYGTDAGIDEGFLRGACALLPVPDAYVLLNVDAKAIQHRTSESNRYESDRQKQERLSRKYLEMWMRNQAGCWPGRQRPWFVIDGYFLTEKVHDSVCSLVSALRPDLGDRLGTPRA